LSGVISAAAVAIGAASYLSELTQTPPEVLIAIIIGVVGLVALWGIAQSVAVAAIITVIEISGLLFVVGWGYFVADPNGVPLSDMMPTPSGPHWVGIGAASLLAFFAFVGFEDMANVAEEVKDPVRTMPKAILWTLALATILYVSTTSAVLYAVPIEKLAQSSAPLSLVFEMAPETVKNTFSLVAIVATLNGVLIQTIMASRVIYGLADRGHLPVVFAKVSERTQTPVVATLAVVLIIAMFALSLPITSLAEHTSQIVLFIFVLVNVALIRIKLMHQGEGGYFRVPMVVPVLGVITSMLLFGTSFL
jgi:APA family basic amino acid/polyamine antiporter